MVTDAEARNAVRELMHRFDEINDQRLSLAYVLARKDLKRYARLLESAERATSLVIQPLKDADGDFKRVYAALEDPEADWPSAILAMLRSEGIELTGDDALRRMNEIKELDEGFGAADNQGQDDERS